MECKFTLNHLFTQSNAVIILVTKSFELERFIITPVQSANNKVMVLSFMILGIDIYRVIKESLCI
jgi:hypothetical protein